MKNKALKHYNRKKFFYRFFMLKSPRQGTMFGLALMNMNIALSPFLVLQWTGELQSVDSPSELKAILRWIFPTGNCVAKWLFPGMGGRFYIGFSLIAIMLRMPEESLGRSKYMTCCEARQKRTGTSL